MFYNIFQFTKHYRAFEAAWIPVSIAESYFKRILSYVSSLHVQVEAAYDVVLMRSLMKRSQGEVSDNRVKYADVLSPGATVKQKLPPWARDLTTKLPPRPAFETPDNETREMCLRQLQQGLATCARRAMPDQQWR